MEQNISFYEKLELIMVKKHNAVLEVSRSSFSEYAWKDKVLQKVYNEAATIKAAHIYTRFIELGKKEGAIAANIPNDAILAYIFSSVSIMQQPDYLKTSREYKLGIFRLFLYGLLGKGE